MAAKIDLLWDEVRINNNVMHNMFCDIGIERYATEDHGDNKLVAPVSKRQYYIENIIKSRIFNASQEHEMKFHNKNKSGK